MSFEENLKIYCIDDDPEILGIVTMAVAGLGFMPVTFTSPEKAIAQIPSDLEDLVMIISDFKMPEMTGLELRERTIAITKNIPFVILSGYISRDDALMAVNLKLSGFIDKPIDQKALSTLIRKETSEIVAALKDEREMVVAFLGDAETLVEQMEDRLLDLEAHPSSLETLNQVFAVAHTIKGGSGFIRPDTLHHFMHHFEEFLAHYKRSALPLDRGGMNVLLKSFDTIKQLIRELKQGERTAHDLEALCLVFKRDLAQEVATQQRANAGLVKTGVSEASQIADELRPATSAKPQDDIRVSTVLLDKFMGHSGEITVIRNMINKIVIAIEKDVPGNRDVQLLAEMLDEMHKINGVMQDNIIDLRKVPLKTVFRPLPRALRDVAVTLGKDIRLEISGDDLRVDNSIAEVLGHSLIHMVRNGADHAIESAEERTQREKNAHGTVKIAAVERGDFIIVSIEDDGKGIDHEVIKAKALSSLLISKEQAQKMSPAELRLLIFHSGFSTAAQVTDISGRGVGMDMVMKEVTRIGGRIEIDSVVGKGSKFSLILPVPKSVNIINALLVRSEQATYCVPQDDIYRLLSLSVAEFNGYVRRVDGADLLNLSGQLYPLVSLKETLRGRAGQRSATSIEPIAPTVEIVLLRAGTIVFGLVADEVIDIEDVVVKTLGRHLRSIDCFSGATFLGDGQVGMILKPEGIALANGLRLQRSTENTVVPNPNDGSTRQSQGEGHLREVVVFELRSQGIFGAYLDDIFRLECFERSQLQVSGEQPVVIYRDVPMPLIDVAAEIGLSESVSDNVAQGDVPTLVIRSGSSSGVSWIGLAVERIYDLQAAPPADSIARDRLGILGASKLGDRTITIIDVQEIVRSSFERIRIGNSGASAKTSADSDSIEARRAS